MQKKSPLRRERETTGRGGRGGEKEEKEEKEGEEEREGRGRGKGWAKRVGATNDQSTTM